MNPVYTRGPRYSTVVTVVVVVDDGEGVQEFQGPFRFSVHESRPLEKLPSAPPAWLKPFSI